MFRFLIVKLMAKACVIFLNIHQLSTSDDITMAAAGKINGPCVGTWLRDKRLSALCVIKSLLPGSSAQNRRLYRNT